METSEHSINVVAMKCCVAVSGELLDRGFVISGLTTGEIRPSKREQHQSPAPSWTLDCERVLAGGVSR